jgi:hypothetical protein
MLVLKISLTRSLPLPVLTSIRPGFKGPASEKGITDEIRGATNTRIKDVKLIDIAKRRQVSSQARWFHLHRRESIPPSCLYMVVVRNCARLGFSGSGWR